MTDHDRGQAAQILSRLRAHWFSLRQGRVVPDRVDVTAAGLGPALDHAFILERIAPGAARLRLAGRHLVDLMGMEVRGMPFCALFNPRARGHLSDVVEAVFRGPQLAHMMLHAPLAAGGEVDGQMLLMPLKSDLGDVTRILGCLVAEDVPARGPVRFDLGAEQFEALTPGGAVLPPGTPPGLSPRPPRNTARPAPEGEAGPRRFRSFAPPQGDPGGRRPPRAPWVPRLVVDNG